MALQAVYKLGETPVIDEANDSFSKQAIATVTAPFSFDKDKVVTRQTQAVNIWLWGAAALVGGEYLGHRRAASGSKPLLAFGR